MGSRVAAGSRLLLEISGEEELQGLVIEKLNFALDGLLAGEVSEGNEIFRVDSDATAIGLSLVERIGHTLVVIMQESPVLHQLDGAGIDGATTLRVLIHDSHLDIFG